MASKSKKSVKKKKSLPKAKSKKAVKKKAAPKKKAKAKVKTKAKAKPKAKAKAKTTVKNKVLGKKAVKKKTAAKKAPAKKKAKAKPKKAESSKDKKKLVVQKHDPSKLDPIVAKIRQKLIQERNELLNLIRSSQEVERNIGDLTFSNEIDLASSLEGREMAFQLSSRERNELKMIEEALFKISAGTYGVCESCSKKIGTKRLQIMPLTPLCIQCQENLEVG